MEINTMDIARASGLDSACISTKLRKEGYSPVYYDYSNHGTAIWNFSSLDEVLDILRKNSEKNYVSFRKILQTYNFTEDELVKLLKANSVTPLFINKGMCYYACDDIKKMTEKFNSRSDNNSEHPLVTDKRCLVTSWFPEVIPKCFEE